VLRLISEVFSDEKLFVNRVFRLSDHCGLDSCISYVYYSSRNTETDIFVLR